MITKYPEHLTQESRLKVVKSYILHELASLTRDKTPDIINIDGLVKKCHEHKKGIEEDCKGYEGERLNTNSWNPNELPFLLRLFSSNFLTAS